MQKKISGWVIVLFCFFLMYTIKSYSQEKYFNFEAADLMNNYFSSLRNGDTVKILDMSTGPFKRQRESLLKNNLQYPEFLRRLNADVVYEILNMNILNDGKTAVEVKMSRNENTQKVIFILMDEDGFLKIYDEQVIP